MHVSPRPADWDEPAGGFLIWLKLARTDDDWKDRFAAHGAKVAAGDHFFASSIGSGYVRLSIASVDDEQIVEGVRRLGAALHVKGGRAWKSTTS